MNAPGTIAVLTSGGDAPGMNACIRAVTRSALAHGLSVLGSLHGFEGLMDDRFTTLGKNDVSNILQRGGTILHAARSDRVLSPEGRAAAAANRARRGVGGLVAIGGEGTFHGADALAREHGVAVVGVPGTIDNDIWGTDFTIGYDTAVNTALEALDRIRDTAAAHERLFIVEVMGRRAGYIALEAGIGSGAEAILLPETRTDIHSIAETIRRRKAEGRLSSIMVVAEGDDAGNALGIAAELKSREGLDCHVTVLGHVQRGGSPTTSDRVLATKLGWAAVEALLEGSAPCMVGETGGRIVRHPLPCAWERRKELDPILLKLASLLV
ncbi:6-phosphofructokinase [Candidatus Fermentibacteria bacterium]|nr:6-phosphofructokinase [Candidatus Fermentibacteria bacterium]